MATASYSIRELYGDAYDKALRQTAQAWNSAHTQYSPEVNWYELEQWADDINLMFNEQGDLLD